MSDLREAHAQKQSHATAQKRRRLEVEEAEREERIQEMRQLSQSLSEGSQQVNRKVRQTSLDECDAAARLDVTQACVSRMWYRASLPFHMVSFKEVVDAFDAVCEYGAMTGRTTFPLPSAPSLRNERLDAEVARLERDLEMHKKSVEQYGLSLQSDGKDNMAHRHLLNVVTCTPLGPQFRETVDVSGDYNNAQQTATNLLEAIGRMSTEEQNALVTVVTDTPAVNRAAWNIIHRKLPKVQCIPCSAHCLNLHFKHIFQNIPEFQETVASAKEIVKRFSNTDFARAQLRKATPSCTKSPQHPSGRNIELYKPGETRFATNYRMLSRLAELKGALRQVAASQLYETTCTERKNPCPVTDIIVDKKFWARLEAWVLLLAPAYKLLREVDTYKPTMSAVYEGALEIQSQYDSCTATFAPNGPLPKSVQTNLKKQWVADWEYLHVDFHAAAYALHPKYQDESMPSNSDIWPGFLTVCDKLLGPEEGALAVEQYNCYHERQGIFGMDMAVKSASRQEPYAWWKCYGAGTPQLQSLAMKVLSQPSSASSAEQSWSEYDFVHNKRRNRLKSAVAAKLVFVHANLRLLSKQKSYARHAQLLVESDKLRSKLSSGDWDGDCSEGDDCDIGSHATVELDTNSFLRDDGDDS